jgi:hypothetical protein
MARLRDQVTIQVAMEEGKNNEKKNDKFNLPKVYPVYKKNIRRKKNKTL